MENLRSLANAELVTEADPTPDGAMPQISDTHSLDLFDAMRKAHVVPLWESPTAHKLDVEREHAHIWPWEVMRPIMLATADLRSPKVVERRVVSLVNPKSRSVEDEATCGAISAALQMILPGELARVHRHSMNALRFILEGDGAETVVDGKRCLMTPGDLIITPAWCWHEHVAGEGGATLWLDVLDVALHLFLGADVFQPGPAGDIARQWPDESFAAVGIVPNDAPYNGSHSPYFRYPWADVVRALAVAPEASDGSRRVRYVDPLHGRSVMPLLDCSVLAPGERATRRAKSSASTLCCVMEGGGSSQIGDRSLTWKPKDVFTIPAGDWASHCATTKGARIFMVSNRDVYARLGLLSEENGE